VPRLWPPLMGQSLERKRLGRNPTRDGRVLERMPGAPVTQIVGVSLNGLGFNWGSPSIWWPRRLVLIWVFRAQALAPGVLGCVGLVVCFVELSVVGALCTSCEATRAYGRCGIGFAEARSSLGPLERSLRTFRKTSVSRRRNVLSIKVLNALLTRGALFWTPLRILGKMVEGAHTLPRVYVGCLLV